MKDYNQNQIANRLRILYLLWVLIGMFSIMYIPSVIIESGNTEKTAANIFSNEWLFRIGIVGRLIVQLLFIVIPLLLYKLFDKTDKGLATLMVVFALVSVPISMYNEVNQIGILSLSGQEHLIKHSLNTYNNGMSISMIFWGLWLFPLGKLAYTSGLFPKVVMYFLYIGGLGYLLASFGDLLFASTGDFLFYSELLTFGELLFIIWFLFAGIKQKEN
ncbi:DUF4386 domain-containing protein [Aureisphaera galaxeae]|uniref:DUF4386 domain-containing protein n=1 Tax=Aureisphaera galaxeae TaxID=1538023 RepID=UPI00234FDD60|nr:DUF4386 domain-containing protein [Aureisphaera galaxeae]MDC8004145.1 DUF4386 domain-containing protein [Aureisphaera galaxeae]